MFQGESPQKGRYVTTIYAFLGSLPSLFLTRTELALTWKSATYILSPAKLQPLSSVNFPANVKILLQVRVVLSPDEEQKGKVRTQAGPARHNRGKTLTKSHFFNPPWLFLFLNQRFNQE